MFHQLSVRCSYLKSLFYLVFATVSSSRTDGQSEVQTHTFNFFLSLQRPQHTLFCGDVASSHKCIKNSALKHISFCWKIKFSVTDVVKEAVKAAERQVTERDDGR